MYTQVWLKFIPVIRIMLKRALAADQVVKMNRTDFDKAGGGKKAGFSFTIEYRNGKVHNRPTSALAKDLIAILQDDPAMNVLRGKSFDLEMSPKCELKIRCLDAGNVPDSTTDDTETAPVVGEDKTGEVIES